MLWCRIIDQILSDNVSKNVVKMTIFRLSSHLKKCSIFLHLVNIFISETLVPKALILGWMIKFLLGKILFLTTQLRWLDLLTKDQPSTTLMNLKSHYHLSWLLLFQRKPLMFVVMVVKSFPKLENVISSHNHHFLCRLTQPSAIMMNLKSHYHLM